MNTGFQPATGAAMLYLTVFQQILIIHSIAERRKQPIHMSVNRVLPRLSKQRSILPAVPPHVPKGRCALYAMSKCTPQPIMPTQGMLMQQHPHVPKSDIPKVCTVMTAKSTFQVTKKSASIQITTSGTAERSQPLLPAR